MPQNYLPFQVLVYQYDQTKGITSIKSSLQVYLKAGETIEIQEPLELTPCNYYLELWVIPDPNKAVDYLWEREKLIDISHKVLYNAAITKPADRYPFVKAEVNSLLNLYHCASFNVTTVVTLQSPGTGGQVSNTISGTGNIVIL